MGHASITEWLNQKCSTLLMLQTILAEEKVYEYMHPRLTAAHARSAIPLLKEIMAWIKVFEEGFYIHDKYP